MGKCYMMKRNPIHIKMKRKKIKEIAVLQERKRLARELESLNFPANRSRYSIRDEVGHTNPNKWG